MEWSQGRDARRDVAGVESNNFTIPFADGATFDDYIPSAAHAADQNGTILRVRLDGEDLPSIIGKTCERAAEVSTDVHHEARALAAKSRVDDRHLIECWPMYPTNHAPEHILHRWREGARYPPGE
jgi:hypothetical protein